MPTGLMRAMTDETDDERMTRLSRDRYERPLPKRFYSSVQVSDANAILLDGRPVKTPMKAALVLPTRAFAEAVAREWEAQEKFINPSLMPLTKYANTAIDRATAERQSVLEDFAKYAGSDLICYRADRPPRLVKLQRQHWDPLLEAVRWHFGVQFKITTGVSHVAQAAEAIAAVQEKAAALDPFHLTILYNLTTLTGSALIAFLLVSGHISPDQAWNAAHVDEDYQIEEWGADAEAMSGGRRAGRISMP
jgi:chaperone required for assembly of F1-ATPase